MTRPVLADAETVTVAWLRGLGLVELGDRIGTDLDTSGWPSMRVTRVAGGVDDEPWSDHATVQVDVWGGPSSTTVPGEGWQGLVSRLARTVAARVPELDATAAWAAYVTSGPRPLRDPQTDQVGQTLDISFDIWPEG